MTLSCGPYRTPQKPENEEPMNEIDKLALKVLEANPSIFRWHRDQNILKVAGNYGIGIVNKREGTERKMWVKYPAFFFFWTDYKGEQQRTYRRGINPSIGQRVEELCSILAEQQVDCAMFMYANSIQTEMDEIVKKNKVDI